MNPTQPPLLHCSLSLSLSLSLSVISLLHHSCFSLRNHIRLIASFESSAQASQSVQRRRVQDMAGALLRRAMVPATRRLMTEISRPTWMRAPQAMAAHVGAGSGGRCGGWMVRSPPQDIPFAVKGLQHIAIAVPDLSTAAEHYRSAFGAQVSDPVDHPTLKVTKVFVQLPNVCIELLHPMTPEGPVAEFLKANPSGGIHHVSFAVDNILSAEGYLGEAGVVSLSSVGTSSNSKSGMFLQPKDNMGVLIQLQQANLRAQPRV